MAHMDMKPANLCLGDDDTLRVVDLGIAVIIDDMKQKIGCLCRRGSWGYVAPELENEDHCGGELCHGIDLMKCDVWSAGVTMLHIWAASVLGIGLYTDARASNPVTILKSLRSDKALSCDSQGIRLIETLHGTLNPDADKRFDVGVCLSRLDTRNS
jgi:hypothetical protein